MTPRDLARIHAESFETPAPWGAEAFESLLGSKNVFLIAQPDGFALGQVVLDEAELLTIAVHPQARARGLAQRLLKAFDAEARERGACIIFLEVAASNDVARHLYAITGFQETGRRPGYYRTPCGKRIDALIYKKQLCGENGP